MTFENIHATALIIEGTGILIRGAARSGKSSLCLAALRRAVLAGMEARLVADDRVDLREDADELVMSAPATLAGLIEVSGVGILRLPFAESARLGLVVDLRPPSDIPRLPETADETVRLMARTIPRVTLPERQAGFTADVLLTILEWRE